MIVKNIPALAVEARRIRGPRWQSETDTRSGREPRDTGWLRRRMKTATGRSGMSKSTKCREKGKNRWRRGSAHREEVDSWKNPNRRGGSVTSRAMYSNPKDSVSARTKHSYQLNGLAECPHMRIRLSAWHSLGGSSFRPIPSGLVPGQSFAGDRRTRHEAVSSGSLRVHCRCRPARSLS